MEVLPTAPLEDLMHSHRSLSQLWERSSLQGVSPPRQPENSDRYPIRAMQQCLRQTAEAGDLDALSAFPIIVKGQRNVHERIPFSLYKDLKKSIKENGLQSPYTDGLFQAITDSYKMAPWDWIALARTVLTSAPFTVWHSEYTQWAGIQEAENAQMNNPVTLPMLLGSGGFATAADQARLDPRAFSQSAQIALRALKAMPSSQAREISSFTNIHQAYCFRGIYDLINHLQEAIEWQIDNHKAAKTLMATSL